MKSVFTLIVGALLLCPVARSQTASSLADRFKQLDRNGDGKLTRDEIPRLFDQLDANHDGVVTLEEAQQYLRANESKVGPQSQALPPPAGPVRASAGKAFTDLRFSKDYHPGTRDARGQFMGGTETMRLIQHKGKLFASLGVWMDVPYMKPKGDQPWTGPQILVKESANGPWRVDRSFPGGYIRVEGMISATFTMDATGARLAEPVTMLIAGPSAQETTAWSRDDATGQWTKSEVVKDARHGGVRSFCTHVDRVTGRQHLFGGTSNGCIFRAAYDPAAPGRLVWTGEPEHSGTGRVMCMAEANGVLYAACGIKDELPLSGGLFRRVDGGSPRWELLWRWPHVVRERGDETEILRGLTAVPDPVGGRHEVLIGTCAYPGVVYRIDPARNHAVTTELDIRAHFAKAWGVAVLRGPCLSAYNNFLPVADPESGEPVHLLGLWINHPDGLGTENGCSAWYLVRHRDGSYAHGRVFDPKDPLPSPPRGLVAARTIEVSPFPEDKGRVLYMGGYDCASVESHNTAWIYRGAPPAAVNKMR